MKALIQFIETRKAWVLPVWIAIATFAFHLFFGIWFVTASPTGAAKTSISVSGDDFLSRFPTWGTEHEADEAFYNRGAMEAMRTGIPRTRSGMFFEHAPLYAWFLGFCYKVGGVRLLALAVPQAILSGLTALFVGLTAARLAPRFANLSALIASSLVLINLHLASFIGGPGPTTMLLFLFSFGVWNLVRVENGRMPLLFVIAMVLGVYTQAAFFVIAFGIVFWALLVFWRGRQITWLIGAALIATFSFAKPLISLCIDRSMETHSTEPPTAVLWEANNPYYASMTPFSLWERRPGNSHSSWQKTEEETKQCEDYLKRAGGNGSRAALLWIRENPKDYLDLCVVRFFAVVGPITNQMKPLKKVISFGTWLILFPAGFMGILLLRGSRFAGLFVCVTLFQVAFETLIIAGWQPRYRLPVDILLCVAAGVLYAAVFGRIFGGQTTPAKPE